MPHFKVTEADPHSLPDGRWDIFKSHVNVMNSRPVADYKRVEVADTIKECITVIKSYADESPSRKTTVTFQIEGEESFTIDIADEHELVRIILEYD
jgi:hypothetical protein